MSLDQSHINGALLRLRREEHGLALSDMANRACMSVKQIKQLEEGGTSSFYSDAVKVTAAKKLGSILGLSVEEVFGLSVTESSHDDSTHEQEVATHNVDLPAEHHDKSVEAEVSPAVVSASNAEHSNSADAGAEGQEDAKSKTPFWMIATLFVAALAVAALMQPEDEPASEPAPPLQVVPAEPSDAASAAVVPASAASSDASGAVQNAAPSLSPAAAPVQTASTTATPAAVATPSPASAARPASSASRVATPNAISASGVAPSKPASVPASVPASAAKAP
jgi:transcriptional regulator with XRE-family HTH domain